MKKKARVLSSPETLKSQHLTALHLHLLTMQTHQVKTVADLRTFEAQHRLTSRCLLWDSLKFRVHVCAPSTKSVLLGEIISSIVAHWSLNGRGGMLDKWRVVLKCECRQHSWYLLIFRSIPEDVDPNDETFVDVHEAARIVHLISEVSRHPAANRAIGIAYNLIRAWIEKMSLNSITENDLHGSNALPTLQAFLSGANTPTRTAKRVTISIQEDLTILMRKWEIGDYGQLPRRGLRRSDPGNTRSPFHPDRTWPFRRGAKYFGNGQLVNGQKWNSRAAMARDGAHGPLIAGISGGKHTGAYSVVMGYHDTYRHDFYADIDCGNRIFYLSTALKAPETDESGNHVRPEPTNHIDPPDAVLPDPKLATPGAQTLMMSHGTGEPVRVFRSFRSAKICPHRPKKGFRYDGPLSSGELRLLEGGQTDLSV